MVKVKVDKLEEKQNGDVLKIRLKVESGDSDFEVGEEFSHAVQNRDDLFEKDRDGKMGLEKVVDRVLKAKRKSRKAKRKNGKDLSGYSGVSFDVDG